VDIEDPTFISNVIDKAETASATTLTPEVKANLNTVLATSIPLLKVYADSNTTASVQRFAFSTLQNDVQDSTVIGSSSSATINQYENNVFGYVATDQGIDEGTINPISNNAPTITSSATFSAAENQTAIGSVTATDADGDSLTYSISGSEINISNSGVLTFATAPDYETKNSYTATVTVSDGTDSVTQAITVTVTDVDEAAPNAAPTITSSATFSAAENQTAIGSISASDPDGDSLTYSISGSEINISSSGVLTFATAPDYETKNSYTATVTVSDGTDSVTQAITVTVTDVDEAIPNQAPSISSSASFSAAENQTAIGSISASDPDGDSLTYSISGSEINISSSGVLTFATAPDYETKNSYTATVTVSDGTDSVTQAITVTVTDVDEAIPNQAPSISSSASFSAAENQTAIGSVTATDADGDSLTYSISGSEINISNSGVLTFATAPDYETKNSYTATVTVSDGTASTTQDITVNVTDLLEVCTFDSGTFGNCIYD
jgi:alpha-L-arabinofuranosidase